MQEAERLAEALKNADAAGDTEAAAKIAQAIRAMGAQEKEKAGVTRSMADSIIELGTGILGAPADIAAALGFEPQFLPTSQDIEGALAQTEVPGFAGAVHSGVGTPFGMDERTRGGEIAKAGMDVTAMAAPISAAPLLFTKASQGAAKATTTLGTIAQDIVQTTAKNPGIVAAAETSAGIGAGIGAGVGEAAFPGSETAHAVGGTMGAVFNPANTIPLVAKIGNKALTQVVSTFSKSGQELRAAKIVQEMIEANGGNVAEVTRLLAMADDVSAPSAIKSGDEGLIKLHQFISKRSASADKELSEGSKAATEELLGIIERLSATGDPQALKMAAIMKQSLMRQQVDDVVTAAESQAAAAGGKIGTSATVEDTGEESAKIIDRAYNMLRQTERSLWSEVPDDAPRQATNLASAWGQMKNEITPELLTERISANFQRAVGRAAGMRGPTKPPQPKSTEPKQRRLEVMLQRIAGDQGSRPQNITSGDLKTLRSDLLAQARALRSGPAPNADAARRFDELADAVAEDLAGLPGYDAARAFSREFHTRFNQTFAGQSRRTKAGGAQSVAPEETTKAAFGGGGAAAERKFGEMESAVGMADDALPPAMRAEQEKFLRTQAEKYLNTDGSVKPGLENFLRNNRRLMTRFPGLSAELSDAKKMTEALKAARASGRQRMAEIERSAISKVVGDENPSNVIGRILSGKTPEADFKQLADAAKESGPEAVAGLRSAALRNMVEGSGSMTAIKESSARLLPLLEKNGVMTGKDLERYRNLVNRGATIENNIARAAQRAEDVAGPVESEVLDTTLRILGAKGGAAVAGKTSGASLVAAGQGSKFLRKALEGAPFNKVMAILEEAAKDPRLMSDLLTKHKTPALREAAARRVHGALVSAGIIQPESD